MRRAVLYRYQIDLDAGVILRDQRLKTRQGLLVKLIGERGTGWGEIAPLPHFSAETLADAQREATAWLKAWCTGEMPADSNLPSVAFGLSCALAELGGRLPAAGSYRGATLCSGDPDALFARLSEQAQPLAKMKVGLYEAVRDGMQVNLLLEALPHLTLRLDANRSWTLEKALKFARYIPPGLRGRIAYLEEPCRTAEESLAFSQQTGIAIAWDETLREQPMLLCARPELKAVIIKPMLTGSLQRVEHQIKQAQQLGVVAVIGSSLESSLCLTQLARIAHSLTPGVQPGLDTLPLMRQQLVRRWPKSALPVTGEEGLQCVWQQ